jgi:hypothetical protein
MTGTTILVHTGRHYLAGPKQKPRRKAKKEEKKKK